MFIETTISLTSKKKTITPLQSARSPDRLKSFLQNAKLIYSHRLIKKKKTPGEIFHRDIHIKIDDSTILSRARYQHNQKPGVDRINLSGTL